MKCKLFISIVILCLGTLFCVSSALALEKTGYVPGEIIVKLKPQVFFTVAKDKEFNLWVKEVTEEKKKTSAVSLNKLLEKHEAIRMEKIGKATPTLQELKDKFPTRAKRAPENAVLPDLSKIYKLIIPQDKNLQDAINDLKNNSYIDYAHPNYYLENHETIPDYYDATRHYYYKNDGSYGTAGADMKCTYAWDISQGSPNITIAVLDTGLTDINGNFTSNIWENEDEINGIGGIDDDNNGYIDDIHGWNFHDRDINGDGNPNFNDDEGHGTRVASTISTNWSSRAIGITRYCKIMPLKRAGAGSDSLSDSLEALYYAVNMGADVINCSWGRDVLDDDMNAISTALDYARANGVLVVVSAGNDGLNINLDQYPHYPASFEHDNLISVAATDQNDELFYDSSSGSRSNYGNVAVDIAAPGYRIYTVRHTGVYSYSSGTSFSAPLVAGAAALMLSVDSTLTPQRIKTIMMDTSDYLTSLEDKVVSAGRLNADNALRALQIVSEPGPPLLWLKNQINNTTHLVKSFEPNADFGYNRAYTYDSALSIIALTASGSFEDARFALAAMISLQEADGSWYNEYNCETQEPLSDNKDNGSIAWMVMAINFYEIKTEDTQYADSARNALDYLLTFRANAAPRQGAISMGTGFIHIPEDGVNIYSTEHNADCYSAFRIRGLLDNNPAYLGYAEEIREWLLNFIWDETEEIFWTGYNGNTGELDRSYFTDCQSWTNLALGAPREGEPEYRASLGSVSSGGNHSTQNTQNYISPYPDGSRITVGGFDFNDQGPDPEEIVWFEGTEGMVSALHSLGAGGARLADIFHDETQKVLFDDGAIPYATNSDNPDEDYFVWKSVAATAWYLFNALDSPVNPFNPFQITFNLNVAEGWNLISIPVTPYTTGIQYSIMDQLTAGEYSGRADKVYGNYDGSYESAWLSEEGWKTNLNEASTLEINSGKGYWIYIAPGHGSQGISIVGEVASQPQEITVRPGWNLIGLTLPHPDFINNLSPAQGSANSAPLSATADRIYTNFDGSSYEQAWLKDMGGGVKQWTSTEGNPSLLQVQPGHGIWYYNAGDASFIW